MKEFTVYDNQTGAIKRWGRCPPEAFALQAKEGEGVIEGTFTTATHVVRAGKADAQVLPRFASRGVPAHHRADGRVLERPRCARVDACADPRDQGEVPQAMMPPVAIVPTRDAFYAHSVLTHPAIFPLITDDSARDLDYELVQALIDTRPEFKFLRCVVGGASAGLFMLHTHSMGTVEVHTCILPEHRGAAAYDLARKCAEWIWSNTPAGVITTLVPVEDKAVELFARRIGFKVVGVIPQSLARGGRYQSQTLLCLTRRQPCQQQSPS
jgi:hypothetical protein